MMYQPAVPVPAQAAQVVFAGPEGMLINWDVGAPGMFDSEPLIVPGRYNFPEGAIYRLKLANIPGRPGVELYPTLEVGPTMPRTAAFLAHNAIPVQITPEDFDQVLSGNFVTKVIYLPDPEFQELAVAGVETLVSTRLDPGVDPIVEADRRGAILGVVRMGNKDLQLPNPIAEAGGVTPAGFGGAIGPDGYPIAAPRDDGRHGSAELHFRRDWPAVGNAYVGHADRTARTSARSARSSCRLAETQDRQPHQGLLARTANARARGRQTAAAHELPAAGESREDRGESAARRPGVSSTPFGRTPGFRGSGRGRRSPLPR
jgi:hypothetical protein